MVSYQASSLEMSVFVCQVVLKHFSVVEAYWHRPGTQFVWCKASVFNYQISLTSVYYSVRLWSNQEVLRYEFVFDIKKSP